MSKWYVAVDGQQQGPMSQDQLMGMIRSGQVRGDTYVFTQGMENWLPMRDVPELNQGGTAAPPPQAASGGFGGMQSHEIDYEIHGEEMQFVEIELDPDETVIAEAGAFMFMEQGIEMETRFGDGSQPDKGFMGKLFEGVKRKFTGESLFMTWFTNKGHGKKHVSFASPYPGKIIAVDLSQSGTFICQKDAFLCAAMGTNVGIAFNKKLGTGFFGGEGFIMQRLQGDGMAFCHAGGTITRRELGPGETLRVDTGCLVGFNEGVTYDIQMVGSLKSAFFGGEGLFLATLTGPGTVYLQSLPFSRLADRIYSAAPQNNMGASTKGEGSVLGGLGNLLDGD
ncbi:MAG: TIGR00266 family protein [Acidobacteriota bacterium]|nr:TIGR00266 family protein [Acidobacteriota bacterium]